MFDPIRSIAVISLVWSGVNGVMFADFGSPGGLRGRAYENCKNCKDNFTLEFWECDHGSEVDDCVDTRCIYNYFRWFECEAKTESTDPGKCERSVDFQLVWREQITHQTNFNMSCGDGAVAPAPGGPTKHECSFWSTTVPKGRCFLEAEDFVACSHGTVVDHQGVNGLVKCKTP